MGIEAAAPAGGDLDRRLADLNLIYAVVAFILTNLHTYLPTYGQFVLPQLE